MKLLFDQNLSASLVKRLSDLYPGSTHVRLVELAEAGDAAVWAYAQEHGLAIVSKDSDFQQRSLLFGSPPKVVWIRLGNCTTLQVEERLRKHSATLHTFAGDGIQSVLVLS
jgi:predicted nuclease of predicted toxin-antitoxin system